MSGTESSTSDRAARGNADGQRHFMYPDAFSASMSELSRFETSARALANRDLVDHGLLADLILVASNPSDGKQEKRSFLTQHSEKPTPNHGQALTLKQLLEDYKTPFIDAYERSKCLKEGQPGKSKTLEYVVDRLRAIPWADRIWIDFKLHPDNPDYNNEKSTITIDLAATPEKQIEIFAHEAFHAAHQFLSKQYNRGKLSKAEFLDIWLSGEVESMLTEVRVYRELGLTDDSPKFKYVENGKVKPVDIEDYVKRHGKEGFVEFLRSHQPAGKNAIPYGEHYARFYDSYLSNFDQNKGAVERYIQKWEQRGNRRDDI